MNQLQLLDKIVFFPEIIDLENNPDNSDQEVTGYALDIDWEKETVDILLPDTFQVMRGCPIFQTEVVPDLT